MDFQFCNGKKTLTHFIKWKIRVVLKLKSLATTSHHTSTIVIIIFTIAHSERRQRERNQMDIRSDEHMQKAM